MSTSLLTDSLVYVVNKFEHVQGQGVSVWWGAGGGIGWDGGSLYDEVTNGIMGNGHMGFPLKIERHDRQSCLKT